MACVTTRLAATLAVSIVLSGQAVSADEDLYYRSLPESYRVANGVEVDGRIHRVPHIVALRVSIESNEKGCGAAFLAPSIRDGLVTGWLTKAWGAPVLEGEGLRWAVTAAHCVIGKTSHEVLPLVSMRTIAGLKNLKSGPKGIQQDVEAVFLTGDPDSPSGFSYGTGQNDIALLRLGPAQPFDPMVDVDFTPSSIAIRTDAPWAQAPYASAFVAGWGRIETGSSGKLFEAQLPLVAKGVCAERMSSAHSIEVPADTLCAGYSTGEYDSCVGDSGGPLFYRPPPAGVVRSDTPLLVGVVSFGADCMSSESGYGIYTDVGRYEAWLRREIEGFEKGN